MWEDVCKKDVVDEEHPQVPEWDVRRDEDDEKLQLTAVPSVGSREQPATAADTGKDNSFTVVNFTCSEHPDQVQSVYDEPRADQASCMPDISSCMTANCEEDIPPTPYSGGRGAEGRLRSDEHERSKEPRHPTIQLCTQVSTAEPGQAGTSGSARVQPEYKAIQADSGGTEKGGECQHTRGGYCLLHGKGAKKMFKPVVNRTIGQGGEVVVKKSRRTWYLCGEDMKKRGGQTQLCFTPVRTTQTTSTSVGGRRRDNLEILHDFSSSTAGQHVGQITSTAGTDR